MQMQAQMTSIDGGGRWTVNGGYERKVDLRSDTSPVVSNSSPTEFFLGWPVYTESIFLLVFLKPI